MEKRDQRINRAEANSVRSEAEQYGRSLELKSEAEADLYRSERMASARKTAFLDRIASRDRLSWLNEVSLFVQTLSDMESGQIPEDAAKAYLARRDEAMAQQAKLTEFRLASEAMAEAMGSREKMLLDTTNIPSWLQLWLTLDQQRSFGIPPGFASPSRRELPQRSPLYPNE